ncbi:MAG: hypothetical protein EA381_04635 [Planctomycetaceae bacterium]|nr:MAG: hypothetical protein EA381_04635 [Planctomycetaceae bacterium]
MNDHFRDDWPPATTPQNPYAPTATFDDAGSNVEVPNSDDEAIRREFLEHEASVQAMGLLFVVGGVLMTLGGAGLLIITLAAARAMPMDRLAVRSIPALLLMAIGIFLWRAGIGLRRFNPPSRICGIVLSCIGLLVYPLGTRIDGYFLYQLISRKGQFLFSPEYNRIRKATPHVRYQASVWVWLLVTVCVLSVTIVVILASLSRI